MRITVEPRDLLGYPASIDILALDRAIDRTTRDSLLDPRLVIDLSRASYLDHDALLMLGGVIASRKASNLGTQLDIPDSPRVVDFLRAWEFPEFIRTVATPLSAFTPASEHLLAEAEVRPPRYIGYTEDRDGQRSRLLLRSSLAITRAGLSGDAWSDAAQATERFRTLNFLSVLKRTIGRKAPTYVPAAIQEAVHNAATHAQASLAYTSCQLRSNHLEDGVVGEMQIGVWDDGESFSATLAHTLSEGNGITSEEYGSEGAVFDVALRLADGGSEVLSLKDSEPLVTTDPGLLSCAAFMLGVSSDPEQSRHPRARPGTDGPTRGGIGLYTLRSIAIDGFGGKITYRSSDLTLTIHQGAQPHHYRVRISSLRNSGWPTKGNLLLIDIPCQT